MKIKFAALEDCRQIHEILQECLIDIDDKNNHNKGKSGFLITNFSEKQFEEMILDNKNNLVFVAKKDDYKEGEVLGYLMGSKFGAMSEGIQNAIQPYLQKMEINDLEKIIYYRQIAVKASFVGKNIGSFLLKNFLQEAKNFNYSYVVCRIILEPIRNQKSISFHQKFGFELIGTTHEKNGGVAGIYFKDLV